MILSYKKFALKITENRNISKSQSLWDSGLEIVYQHVWIEDPCTCHIWFPADGQPRVVGDEWSVWVTATNMGDINGIMDSCLLPDLVLVVTDLAEEISRENLSPSLSPNLPPPPLLPCDPFYFPQRYSVFYGNKDK